MAEAWVSVRCLFRSHHEGGQVYEERVTLWRSTSISGAIELAEEEAYSHAALLTGPPGWPTEYLGLAQAYLLADEVEPGAEVFSLMRSSDLGPADYLDTFFDTGRELAGREPETDT